MSQGYGALHTYSSDVDISAVSNLLQDRMEIVVHCHNIMFYEKFFINIYETLFH